MGGIAEQAVAERHAALCRTLNLPREAGEAGFGVELADPDRSEEFATFASLAKGWGSATEGELIDLVLQSANLQLERGGGLGPGFLRFLRKGPRLRAWRARMTHWTELNGAEFPIVSWLKPYRKHWWNRKRYVLPAAFLILVAMVFGWFATPRTLPMPEDPFSSPIRFVSNGPFVKPMEFTITREHPLASVIESWSESDGTGWRPTMATYASGQVLLGDGFHIEVWSRHAAFEGMIRPSTEADLVLYEALVAFSTQERAARRMSAELLTD